MQQCWVIFGKRPKYTKYRLSSFKWFIWSMCLRKLLQTKNKTVFNLSNKSILPSSAQCCSHSNPISQCCVFAINNRVNNTDALPKVKLTMDWHPACRSLTKVILMKERVWFNTECYNLHQNSTHPVWNESEIAQHYHFWLWYSISFDTPILILKG